MPAEFQTLLPSSSTPWMRAVEQTSGERWPLVDVDVIRRFKDPWTCPEHLLNFLAFERSVDIWDETWDVLKKRSVIASAPADHRLKGTDAGIRRYLAIADCGLPQVITPPQRAFASAPITAEQRNAWLARMPQVRVYLVSEVGVRGADAFCGHAFVGHAFARLDRGLALHGRKAVLRQPDGTETSLRRANVETTTEARAGVQYDRFFVPGNAGPALFVGGFARGRFLTRKFRAPYIVTVGLDRAYDVRTSRLHLDTVQPGLEPIDVKADRLSVIDNAGPALFVGGFARGRFLLEDRAEAMLYDRIYLHDPAVDAPWTRAHSFVGSARLGMRPFRAELLVDASGVRSRKAAFTGRSYLGRSYLRPRDLSKLAQAMAAIRASKALRDRILISTQTRRPRRLADRIPLDGSFRLGQSVANRL